MRENGVKCSFAAVELLNVRKNDLTVLLNGISFYGVAFQLQVVSLYDNVKILFIV